MADLSGHVEYVCTKDHDDRGCMFCDGGLFACSVCNAFEGATPDQCPGVQMTYEQSEAVYAGRLNYREGAWRDECCEIMRPIYDRDNYLAEAGYAKCSCGQWNLVGDSCGWPHLHKEVS